MKKITVEEAYKLANWATRVACPAFLEYDDGVRKCFPEQAKRLRNLFEIKDRPSADSAIHCLSKEIIPPIAEFRDGMVTVPLRQAHWLCMAAMMIECKCAVPADYGAQGIYDLAAYMKVPLNV